MSSSGVASVSNGMQEGPQAQTAETLRRTGLVRLLLRALAVCAAGPDLLYNDTDRDGSFDEAADYLRFRQLIFGLPPSIQPWREQVMLDERP